MRKFAKENDVIGTKREAHHRLRFSNKVGKALPFALAIVLSAFTAPSSSFGDWVSGFQVRQQYQEGTTIAETHKPSLEKLLPRVIVIDPGHGGDDVGAKGPTGVEERHLTLELAFRLKAYLSRTLGSQVILTREVEQNLPLEHRTGIANHQKADVFISLHANASFSPSLSGFSCLVFAPAEVAQNPSKVRRTRTQTPWSSLQKEHVPESMLLARLIQTNIASRGLTQDRGMQEGPFVLLEGAAMPAIAVEVGFLTNPEEEQKLKTSGYLDKMAEAIAKGVKEFAEARRWY